MTKLSSLAPQEAEVTPWDTLCIDLISPYTDLEGANPHAGLLSAVASATRATIHTTLQSHQYTVGDQILIKTDPNRNYGQNA